MRYLLLFYLQPLFQRIYGSSATQPLKRHILLWVLQYAGLMFGISALNNYLLGIPTVWISLLSSLACFITLVAVHRNTSWNETVLVVPLSTYLFVATDAWFYSAGINGSVPLFLSVAVISVTVLVNGWARTLTLTLLILHLTILTGFQWYSPASVLAYESTAIHWIDIWISGTLVSMYVLGCVTIINSHLYEKHRQAESLLLSVLPHPVANTLRHEPTERAVIAESFDDVSVMFAYVVGFNEISAKLRPEDQVLFLDELSSYFELLVSAYRVEKIKTFGPNYMIAAGVPYSEAGHASRLVRMALTIQTYIKRQRFYGHQLEFRIGINSGPAIAGVIGKQRYAYDLWGDTVNVASRMESQGLPGAIQITRRTYEQVAADFDCIYRGTIDVRGKGAMEIWHVVGGKTAPVVPDLSIGASSA